MMPTQDSDGKVPRNNQAPVDLPPNLTGKKRHYKDSSSKFNAKSIAKMTKT